MVLGKRDIHMKKNETSLILDHSPINSKWVKDFIRPETVKHLEENIGGKLTDFGLGDDVLGVTLKAQVIKAQINKQGCLIKASSEQINT